MKQPRFYIENLVDVTKCVKYGRKKLIDEEVKWSNNTYRQIKQNLFFCHYKMGIQQDAKRRHEKKNRAD